MLERALERVVAERTSHLFTLLGPAGVGKSRLVERVPGRAGLRARRSSGVDACRTARASRSIRSPRSCSRPRA